jgi:hypothetical protein
MGGTKSKLIEQKEMIKEREFLCKDLWKDIFIYLNGEDLLNCSLVCKYFYQLQSNNDLWFQKVLDRKLYLKQKVSIHHPIVCYYQEVNYKQYYLSLFHHSYEFKLFMPYKNLRLDYQNLVVNGLEEDYVKNKWKFVCVFVPLQIILFPVYCFVELIEFYYCKTREKNYCDCNQCKWKQMKTLCKIKR